MSNIIGFPRRRRHGYAYAAVPRGTGPVDPRRGLHAVRRTGGRGPAMWLLALHHHMGPGRLEAVLTEREDRALLMDASAARRLAHELEDGRITVVTVERVVGRNEVVDAASTSTVRHLR